ncbi:MAG: radical SAM protein [Thermoplasmata archaeon]
MNIRLSLASAIYLGFKPGNLNFPVSTIYIMFGEKCYSNCSFCAQAYSQAKENMLSRVPWFSYDADLVIGRLRVSKLARICVQTLDYPGVEKEILVFLGGVKKLNMPVSISITPISNASMTIFRDYADTISFALDAATPALFEKYKGYMVGNRFTWEDHWNALLNARKIFEHVNTHVIVGLGENDRDLIELMLRLKDSKISIALFAYTPINKSLNLKAPDLNRYRKVQLARYLIENYDAKIQNFEFENNMLKNILFENIDKIIEDGIAFMTSGCKGCNRPYYNERPGKAVYNIPYHPSGEEIKAIKKELKP